MGVRGGRVQQVHGSFPSLLVAPLTGANYHETEV